MENVNQTIEKIENNNGNSSPFMGTPWGSDQEIYVYASHLRYELGWDWNNVKNDLVHKGLEEGYTDAIIQNLINTYGNGVTGVSSNPNEIYIDNRGMFRRPFSFQGRIRRTEFGLSLLIYYAVLWIGGFILGSVVGATDSDVSIIFLYLLMIPGFWFLWAQGAKRCHDLGHSGWFMFIPFYILWMLFVPGDRETTGYGTSPKANYSA